jgi:hypothetical protein
MKYKTANQSKFLYLASVGILLVGLGSSVVIYLAALDHTENVTAYENGDGYDYQIPPEDTKQYLRSMELYGGTANVLAEELRNWFDGLWHGKSLALTLTCITVVLSSGLYLVANRLPSKLGPDSKED